MGNKKMNEFLRQNQQVKTHIKILFSKVSYQIMQQNNLSINRNSKLVLCFPLSL